MSFVAKCFENVHEILGIKVEPGTENKVKEELKKAKEVSAVYTALGEYDIIALLTIEDSHAVNQFIIEKVQKMEGVLDTKVIPIKK